MKGKQFIEQSSAFVPVKDHGEAEVGEGDLHDKTAPDPVHLLEVVVAVQQGQASGDKMVLYIYGYIHELFSKKYTF